MREVDKGGMRLLRHVVDVVLRSGSSGGMVLWVCNGTMSQPSPGQVAVDFVSGLALGSLSDGERGEFLVSAIS